MRERWAAVVLQRAEQWIGIDLVGRTVARASGVVTQIIPERCNRAKRLKNVVGCGFNTFSENRIPDRQRPVVRDGLDA